jgi:hypothetical protein
MVFTTSKGEGSTERETPWAMTYWLLIFGLISAIASVHVLMSAMINFPNLPKPSLRLKMPEPPRVEHLLVAGLC